MLPFKKIFTILVLCSAAFSGTQALPAPADSVGIRTVGERNYIVHRVEKGETMYALSRKYNVDVQTLMDLNPGSKQGINVGQELLIPTNMAIQQASSEQQESPDQRAGSESQNTTEQQGNAGRQSNTREKITHTVAPGESLYLIGRKYDVSVNDIRSWNSLRNNTISVGQRLNIYLNPEMAAEINQRKEVMETHGKKVHVVSNGETLYSIAGKYNISVSDLREWNRLESNVISIGQELIVGYTGQPEEKVVIVQDLEVEEAPEEKIQVTTIPVPETGMEKVQSSEDAKKVTQRGIARVIEGSESTRKYLALHRTAAIGTIMQVKNEMNDLSVFVRVIGKIPDTDDNRNIMIKVSKVAYDRLGAIDQQFPVEVTYHP